MLLIDFCNVKEWNLKAIEELYRSYAIVHTKQGKKRSWETYCRTKYSKKKYYFSVDNVAADRSEAFNKRYRLPSHSKYKELWRMLERSQKKYRLFLDQCIDGRLDLEHINKLASGMKIRFVENPRSPFLPTYYFESNGLEDIESYVDRDVVDACLTIIGRRSDVSGNVRFRDPNASVLGRIRKCPFCEKYFIFPDRPTRVYCSNRCRYSYNNMKDTKSGKRREHMKRGRAKGKFQ
jgi:hypothetical protein